MIFVGTVAVGIVRTVVTALLSVRSGYVASGGGIAYRHNLAVVGDTIKSTGSDALSTSTPTHRATRPFRVAMMLVSRQSDPTAQTAGRFGQRDHAGGVRWFGKLWSTAKQPEARNRTPEPSHHPAVRSPPRLPEEAYAAAPAAASDVDR